MSVSTPTTNLSNQYFLAIHGSKLAGLLKRAKTDRNVLYKEVEDLINLLLNDLTSAQGMFIEESLVSIIRKVRATLEEFIKLDTDNATQYTELAEKIKSFKSQRQSSSDDASQQQEAYAFDLHGETEQDPELNFENLTAEELYSLISFCLLPDGTEIAKRELRYWWIGVGISKPCGYQDDCNTMCEIKLDKLVEYGFIERAITNKTAFNVYRMCAGVRSKVLDVETGWSFAEIQQGRFSVIGRGDKAHAPEPEKIETLVNIREYNLNNETLSWLSSMKNLQVLYIGTWRHKKTEDYIVVEDADDFGKVFKHLKQLRCLSLQGLSGIVTLPDSVFKLRELKVLDLRLCNSLEVIPKGIESLAQLTHLDLSRCYLLDHIPEGVAYLYNLLVLKGFIINAVESESVTADLKGQSSCALFSNLSRLKYLVTLTVRTRRMNFPNGEDFETLHELPLLANLKITWVESPSNDVMVCSSERFPASLRKLEFQAAPKSIASKLLGLIRENENYGPEKLCIRGGELEDLGPSVKGFNRVKVVRLRHLPKLHLRSADFIRSFPNLMRLEIFQCPNIIMFPYVGNGVWEQADLKLYPSQYPNFF